MSTWTASRGASSTGCWRRAGTQGTPCAAATSQVRAYIGWSGVRQRHVNGAQGSSQRVANACIATQVPSVILDLRGRVAGLSCGRICLRGSVLFMRQILMPPECADSSQLGAKP